MGAEPGRVNMKVRLNLATSPLENRRRFALGAAVVGSIAVVALVLLSWHAYKVWHADRDHRAKMARLERGMNSLREQRRALELFFNLPENVKLRDRSAFLNGLIEQRSFPWTKIFMDLERSLPEGVRVVSISPKMSNGRVEVKLIVGATSDESKLKFLRALEDSREFSRIQVLAETLPSRPGESDKVMLELVAWYAST
jgi:Tfp pilus assembly protein PilN